MEGKERYINLSDRQVKDTQNNSQGFMSINSICKTLNQQDKELSKLRASYQQVKEENSQLKQQLAITEKALELACERVKYFEEMQDKEMGFYEFFGYDSDYDLKAIIEQYKQQAKEMLENE